MTWTREKPTLEGAYWSREHSFDTPGIAVVYKGGRNGQLRVKWYDGPPYDLDEAASFEWYGPLKAPP